jgi:hypothetical protein
MAVSSSSFWLTHVEMADARGKSPLAMEHIVGGAGNQPMEAPAELCPRLRKLGRMGNPRAMQNLSDANSLFEKTL